MEKFAFAVTLGALLLSTSAFAQTTTRSTSQSGATAIAVGGTTLAGNTSGVPGAAAPPTAPSIVVASPCMGAVSGSGTSPMLGISLGMSYKDKECEARANAGALFALGQPAAAMQVLCQVDNIRHALAAAGKPCDGFTASVAVTTISDNKPDYCFTADAGERAQHRECQHDK